MKDQSTVAEGTSLKDRGLLAISKCISSITQQTDLEALLSMYAN